jgi:RNA polymerase sigma-70 factor (sigma-E family)
MDVHPQEAIAVEPPGPADRARPPDFDEFYRDRFAPMARLALLLTGELASAEDIAQEALTRVHGSFARLDAPSAYLRTVVVNLCRRHRRGNDRRRALGERMTMSPPAEPAPRELLDAIDALPYRQKAVVVLRYYEDLSEAEIAAVLGCRPGTVKSSAARALARLRQEVER